jgi:general secretion pathway protein E
MNIAERRRPQDGQLTSTVGGNEVDVRVATMETSNGEMMVLRILDKSFSFIHLAELGLRPEVLQGYTRLLRSPFGMLLVSGPTGSGKTTTLYASLNQLDHKENNVMTIEDPVEYRFDGINQIQINPLADITFARGLRAMMRLDPDIILVGEIRDQETAQIAVQSALTGHLVLSSVHANDAPGSLLRLVDLGVDAFSLTSAVIGILAQRLVRRVCPHCSVLREGPVEEQIAYEQELGESRREFYYGSGCNFCAGTGYLGRMGVHELLIVSEAMRALLLRRASHAEMRAQALADGLVPMRRDGMLKVREGQTTPHEIIRNVYTIGLDEI